MFHHLAIVLVTLLACASSARAVTIAWSPVGNPGNSPDPVPVSGQNPIVVGSGAVAYNYSISTYDVTNSQYIEFLNTVDPTGANKLGLYSAVSLATLGGITLNSSAANGSKYSSVPGRENLPANWVNLYDSMRFANWLNNGGTANSDTETGSYTLLGGTPIPSNGNNGNIPRNAGAHIVIPNTDEWYKAAYYNPATSTYFLWPNSSNTIPTGEAPTGGANSANGNGVLRDLTDVGAYALSKSPSGAFDMAGDVSQWTENFMGMPDPHGAYFGGPFDPLAYAPIPSFAVYRSFGVDSSRKFQGFGIRLAMVPEPGSIVLALFAMAGLIGSGWWRRSRR